MNIHDLLEIGRIKSKSLRYKQLKEKAINTSAELLLKHNNPYLAISGGKDSVAMAFIVNEASVMVNKSFRLWCHASDASFPGTIETVRKVAETINKPLDIFESNKAFEYVKSKQKKSFGKTGVFFDSVREYAEDKDLCFVGVRAYESKRRMNAAKAHGMVYYSKDMGDITVCNPLQWFKLEDVAAALYEFNAPLHPIYYKHSIDGKNKFGEDQFIRLGYITSKDLLSKGTAVFLKLNYPDIFNKLCKEFPQIREYV